MFDDIDDLYQQVILDHNKSPRNFRVIEGADFVAKGHNPLCGDEVEVYLKMDGNRIEDLSFQGSGCAISKASASLMTTMVKGKSVEEAKQLFAEFREMATTGKIPIGGLGKLEALAGVYQYPARVKCAVLAWHAMAERLNGSEESISTES